MSRSYALSETVRHSGRPSWHVCACSDAPAPPNTIDVPEGMNTMTIAPAAYVEFHPAWDGTDEGCRNAVLAWAAEQ